MARKTILYEPACMKVGVQSNVPVPLALSTKVAPPGRVEVVNVGMVASGSLAEMVNVRRTASVVERAPIAASTGA